MTMPEFPAGAIHNGRVHMDCLADRVQVWREGCQVSIDKHPDWQELRSCFEHLATYAEQAEQAKQACHNNLIKMMSQHAAAFKVLADIQKDRSAFTSALINAVVDDVRDLLANLDDETGSIRVGDNASCPICTVGTVPHDRDKGPCAYHRLLSVIEDQDARAAEGDGQPDEAQEWDSYDTGC